MRDPEILPAALSALNAAKLDVLASHASGRGVDIQFMMADGTYDEAVRVLHKVLIEGDEAENSPAQRSAA